MKPENHWGCGGSSSSLQVHAIRFHVGSLSGCSNRNEVARDDSDRQGLEGALTTLKGQVATVEHNLQVGIGSIHGILDWTGWEHMGKTAGECYLMKRLG